jgi:DNA gyrase subunit B
MIDKGHLFIAQPPLLKVGKGKDEMYLKDESELDNWILRKVCQQRVVTYGPDQQELSDNALFMYSTDLAAYLGLLSTLTKRGLTPRLAEMLIDSGLDDKSFLQDEQRMTGLKEVLVRQGHDVEGPAFNADRGVFELVIKNKAAATVALFAGPESKLRGSIKIGRGLIYSNEFQKCIDLKRKIAKYDAGPFTVHSTDKGGERFKAAGREELLDHLLKEGKKGLAVQRYKGLGEMNPEQLWETTMNPEEGKRTLLRVKIEDFVDADEIFTILMGEEVEPRRDFIQTNALEVSTLDI